MSIHSREAAKFLCGVEAFHALMHAVFWYRRTTLHIGPIEETPEWHKSAAIGNALVALALGAYGWSGPNGGRALSSDQHRQ